MTRIKFFLKTSALVFVFLVGAKALNFFKKILIGKLFGVSSVADAFFAASYLPYYISIFFDSIFFLVFLPLYQEVFSKKGNEGSKQFLQEILLFIFLGALGLSVFFWFKAGWLMKELVPGFKVAQQEMTIDLFRIFSLALVFMALRAVFQALNSFYNHYAAASSTGLVDSLTMLGVTLAGWKTGGIYAAAWAGVAGAAISFFLQIFSMMRHREIFPASFSFNLRTPWRLGILFVPMGIIWLLQQIPQLVLNRFGSGMWEGTISAINISQTLSTVPLGLLSQTVLFAVFPAMVKKNSENPGGEVRETFLKTLKGAFLLLIPTGFLISALARPIAALFFEGGGINAEGTRRIANSLVCFGWAAFAMYADLFMSQTLIGLRKTIPAVLLYTTRAVLTYGLGYVFTFWWDYQGLALGFSLALVINLFVFFPLFFKASPLDGRWKGFFTYFLKIFMASSPAVVLGLLLNHWPNYAWMGFSKFFIAWISLLSGLVFYAVFVAISAWMRVEEIALIGRGLQRLLFSKTALGDSERE